MGGEEGAFSGSSAAAETEAVWQLNSCFQSLLRALLLTMCKPSCAFSCADGTVSGSALAEWDEGN